MGSGPFLFVEHKPGAYFTYPPLHALLLALLTWPGRAGHA